MAVSGRKGGGSVKLKGSYTVEAALVMGILLPLLAGIIYLGFYLHNDAVMKGAAYELAVLGCLQDDEEKRKTAVEERKQEIIGRAFLGLTEVRAEVSLGEEKVSASLRGTFRVPGLVMRYFCGNQLELSADAELTVADPGKQIYWIHRLKKSGEEDGDGSKVSP